MRIKHNILIVDDDADDREIIKDAFLSLEEEQEFIFLENGDKLIEYLEHNVATSLPSLILLDLNMPGNDGREVLKQLKTNKRYQHIPTIVLTTSSSNRDKLTSYDLGANCFITKPDTFNKMIDLTKCISKLWLQ
jgi:CheY-like chemotaxis protein